MKHIYVLSIILFFILPIKGQSSDYLRILKSFPSIPENTLTASKAEIESYKEKLSQINTLLWNLEAAQKEKESEKEKVLSSLNLNQLDGIEKARKEWDLLYQQVIDSTMQFYMIELDIVNQWREGLIGHKTYDSNLQFNKQMDVRNRENLQNLLDECEKIAPLIKKLDDYSVDGYKISDGSVGLMVLRDLYKSFERVFYYNLGIEG